MFAEIFPVNCDLGELGSSLPVFPLITNIERNNISKYSVMVQQNITALDSSKKVCADSVYFFGCL